MGSKMHRFWEVITTFLHRSRWKRWAVVLCALLCAHGLQAQPNQTDAKGRKQGAWEKHYPDGKLRYTGQFVDDRPVGMFRYFYPDGKPRAEHQYRAQPGRCTSVQFDEQGVLMARGVYQDEKKDSVWNYYNSEGKTIAVETYRLGVLEGPKTTFHLNGKPAEVTNYVGGQREGSWTRFSDAGIVLSKANYAGDKLEGEAVYWDNDGNKLLSGRYQQGLETGWWVVYEEGRPKERIRYRAGKEVERSPIN